MTKFFGLTCLFPVSTSVFLILPHIASSSSLSSSSLFFSFSSSLLRNLTAELERLPTLVDTVSECTKQLEGLQSSLILLEEALYELECRNMDQVHHDTLVRLFSCIFCI